MDFESEIKDKLQLKGFQKVPGTRGGGCINEGEAYETDDGRKLFVKECDKENACQMVSGEFASLQAIRDTNTVRVPEPVCTVFAPDASSAVLVMEYLSLNRIRSYKLLGEHMKRLHGHNESLRLAEQSRVTTIGGYNNNQPADYVQEFGFDVTTCCGSIPMNNEWHPDWESFFARNRLAEQLALIEEKFSDRLAIQYWSELQILLPRFFKQFHGTGSEKIVPSLLHGDLWSGNAAETDNGPVVFDAASFYGHWEYDLAIAKMFGGFSQSFYDSFFGDKCLPSPETERRIDLYQLFHYLNHWNHFGSGYRLQSLELMKRLIRSGGQIK